jgi:IS30 family transposase
MSDLTKKNKHLSLDDRMEIQECLNHGATFKAAAARIGKDQTTVSKEVKRHIVVKAPAFRQMKEDGTPIGAPPCPKLLKAPFVCNPCDSRHKSCAFAKQFYHAKHAQKAYEALLVESREGIPLNKESFYEMDAVVSDGVGRGQHLYHIMQTHDLGVSKSTVYRHLKRGYLSVSAIDFPRLRQIQAAPRPEGRPHTKSRQVGPMLQRLPRLRRGERHFVLGGDGHGNRPNRRQGDSDA